MSILEITPSTPGNSASDAATRSEARPKLEKLDALRGLAAVYVVIHHSVANSSFIVFGLNIANVFRFGEEAVILFFLLSGFVINFTFVNSRDKTFKTYFFKRATRIYIPLLIVMALGFAIECYDAGELANAHPGQLLLNLLMLQDISSLKPNVVVDPYMHNSPLWSLSYEWWFYMLYFQVQKYIPARRQKDLFVYGVAILAAAIYLYSPTFIPRLLMYMSIWWLGVILSNMHLARENITLPSLAMPLTGIAVIVLLCGIGVYRASMAQTLSSMGVHPVLEMRDHFSAIVIVAAAVFWKSQNWLLFDKLVKPFLVFAPVSYVIYISHHYFVVNAHYFAHMENRALEFAAHFLLLLAFSYLVEIVVYPRILKGFSSRLMRPAQAD